jgi:branched-chain amino acid transport system substrate-binding protein
MIAKPLLLKILALVYLMVVSWIPLCVAEGIQIGLLLSKTGNAVSRGESYPEGVYFAVQELNRKGGVLGKQLEIIEFLKMF